MSVRHSGSLESFWTIITFVCIQYISMRFLFGVCRNEMRSPLRESRSAREAELEFGRTLKLEQIFTYTIPNPLFGHHPLLGQSHIVTPYIETQPGLKLGRSVTPAPCTARGITATQLYQPLVSAMVLLECIVLKIWLKCIKITM
jgi:hypothetical protein